MGSSRSATIHNYLLASLAPGTLASLLPKLDRIALPPRQAFYEPGAVIDSVYFPESGMFSLVANFDDGAQVEVGLIGREGALGATILSGVDTSFVEAVVQMPGEALRMSARLFRHEADTNPAFRSLLLRYGESLQAQIMQTAACNARHALEQRLARWLLMAHDRAEGDVVPLTQEFMAVMLGVQRPSITVTAGILQRAGLIRYSAGRIMILDRTALETASCECYGAVQRRFAELVGAISPKPAKNP